MPKDAKIKVPGSNVLLTPRQELFCHEFLKDLNATGAAIRAGYSKNNASKNAYMLTKDPNISERLAELKAEQTKRTKIEADDILRRLVRISEKTEQEGDYNAAIRSLELLGKHQAMWTDKSINETTTPQIHMYYRYHKTIRNTAPLAAWKCFLFERRAGNMCLKVFWRGGRNDF